MLLTFRDQGVLLYWRCCTGDLALLVLRTWRSPDRGKPRFFRNASLKQNPGARRFVEANTWSETLHWKRNASVEAKYSFIPTQEKAVINFEVIQNLFIPTNFCYRRLDILKLDKILSWQIGSGWRFIECIPNASWLMIHDLGKRRSQRDSTVYNTAMKLKFRNLLNGKDRSRPRQWQQIQTRPGPKTLAATVRSNLLCSAQ